MLCVQHAQQFALVDDENSAWRNRCSGAHPDRLARHASLAKKIIRAKHGDHCFFSGTINDSEFNAALLDVHDAIRSLTLRVDRFASAKFRQFSCHARCIEKQLWVENLHRFCGFLLHIQVEHGNTPLRSRSWVASNINKGVRSELSETGQTLFN